MTEHPSRAPAFVALCTAVMACGGNVVVDAKGMQSGTTSGTQGSSGSGTGGAAVTSTTGSGAEGTGGSGGTSGVGAGGSTTTPPTAIAVHVADPANPYVALVFGTLQPSCSSPNSNGFYSVDPMACDGNWMVEFDVPLTVLYAGSVRDLKQDNCAFATYSGPAPCNEQGGSGDCQLDGHLKILDVDATSITFSFNGTSTEKGALFNESGTFVARRCP
jgi:hypothetical protein